MENATNLTQFKVTKTDRHAEKNANCFIKRFVDIFLASFFLVLSLPLLIIISFLIKLTSKGPLIFVQERVTLDNKIFRMYKFRTMVDGAENYTGPVISGLNDSRCTRIGKILRKLSFDELPQFINVIKGEMSLVGPRPERLYFINIWKDQIENYNARNTVKAGITGWAQVNGLRGDTSIEERLLYDIYYINNWNLLFDFKIIIKTFFVIFGDFFSK